MTEDRRVVLGPCPCRGCGESVYWDGWGWRNVWRKAEHICRSKLRAEIAACREVA